jgi:hypothetical protein
MPLIVVGRGDQENELQLLSLSDAFKTDRCLDPSEKVGSAVRLEGEPPETTSGERT